MHSSNHPRGLSWQRLSRPQPKPFQDQLLAAGELSDAPLLVTHCQKRLSRSQHELRHHVPLHPHTTGPEAQQGSPLVDRPHSHIGCQLGQIPASIVQREQEPPRQVSQGRAITQRLVQGSGYRKYVVPRLLVQTGEW